MGARERETLRWMAVLMGLLVLAALPACSSLFPHTELAIQPEGATLDELGLALLADVERWIDTLLWVGGVLGWL